MNKHQTEQFWMTIEDALRAINKISIMYDMGKFPEAGRRMEIDIAVKNLDELKKKLGVQEFTSLSVKLNELRGNENE